MSKDGKGSSVYPRVNLLSTGFYQLAFISWLLSAGFYQPAAINFKNRFLSI